jgi:hypothetical protein
MIGYFSALACVRRAETTRFDGMLGGIGHV